MHTKLITFEIEIERTDGKECHRRKRIATVSCLPLAHEAGPLVFAIYPLFFLAERVPPQKLHDLLETGRWRKAQDPMPSVDLQFAVAFLLANAGVDLNCSILNRLAHSCTFSHILLVFFCVATR